MERSLLSRVRNILGEGLFDPPWNVSMSGTDAQGQKLTKKSIWKGKTEDEVRANIIKWMENAKQFGVNWDPKSIKIKKK